MAHKRTPLLAMLLGLIAIGSLACGSSSDENQATIPQGELNVLAAAADFSVGENRFSFVILDNNREEIIEPKVQVAFGVLESQGQRSQSAQLQLKNSAEGIYRRVVSSIEHTHEGGEVHSHEDVRGVYVVENVNFDSPGIWMALVSMNPETGGDALSGTLAFEVKERSDTPAVGEMVPASANPTVADVVDISEIDTSVPPKPQLHQISVEQALAKGRPFLVVFATPAFCRSRLCGPVVEVVDNVRETYEGRAEFIHIEPYELAPLREDGVFKLSKYSEEWNLPSEPWVFLVDSNGRLFGKFEGLVTADELGAAMGEMLEEG